VNEDGYVWKTQLSSLRDVGPEEAMLAARCAVRRMVHGPHPALRAAQPLCRVACS